MVVVRYMEKHPELLHLPFVKLALDAKGGVALQVMCAVWTRGDALRVRVRASVSRPARNAPVTHAESCGGYPGRDPR